MIRANGLVERLAEASTMLGAFIADPAQGSPSWQELSSTTDDSLCIRIRAALGEDLDSVERYLGVLLEQVTSQQFYAALKHIATGAGVSGAENRQFINAEALIRTALVAVDAKRVERLRGNALSTPVGIHLSNACRLLGGSPSRSRGKARAWRDRATADDAAELVRKGLVSIESSGSVGTPRPALPGYVVARYWINSYWLGNPEGNNSNVLQLPTVTLHSRATHHFVGTFKATLLATERIAVLGEHPTIALLCLGSSLVQSVERAWRAAPDHTAVWSIDSPSLQAQDDESLSGAAAVVFHALATDSNLNSDILVLARLNEDFNILEPVQRPADKIAEALRKRPDFTILLGSASPPSDVSSEANCGIPLADLQHLRTRLHVTAVGNLREGVTRAISRAGPSSDSQFGPYPLKQKLGGSSEDFELWDVSRGEDSHFLLKRWRVGPGQHLLMRASWDRELRTLYRVCSLPRAEELLLVLHDSLVVDGSFGLVMRTRAERATGPPRILKEALQRRSEHSWLEASSIESNAGRAAIWRGLRHVFDGLRLLHSQNVVHRNLSAESVFFSGVLSEESIRLGGFEWSARMGGSLGQDRPSDWATPPDLSSGSIAIDSDWYGFGMLAARCFHDLESLEGDPSHELNRRVVETVGGEHGAYSPLKDAERALILKLIDSNRGDRVKDPSRIGAAIERILQHLTDRSHSDLYADANAALFVVCNSKAWVQALSSYGFHPVPGMPSANYDCTDPDQRIALKKWLRERFRRRVLYRIAKPDEDEYWLEGDSFALRLRSHRAYNREWTMAFAELMKSRNFPERATVRDLSYVPIEFLLTDDNRSLHPGQRNWQPYLPPRMTDDSDRNQARETLVRFLRCTNQLDLLLSYSHIFPCNVESLGTEGTLERLRITSRVVPDHGLPGWLRASDEDGMLHFFREKFEGPGPEGKHVLLTDNDVIRTWSGDKWDLVEIESPANIGTETRPSALILARAVESVGKNRVLPHGEKWLRAADHFAQEKLIERRGKAISQIAGFRYLLNALASPSIDWMSGAATLELSEAERQNIDRNKQAVLADILNARPIYALQGPPGTGKTTLITHLTRQILKEDRTAQILITAQAHGAVQRLQEELRKAFMEDVEPPLAIRLGIDDEEELIVVGPNADPVLFSLGFQTEAILQKTLQALDDRAAQTLRRGPRASIEVEWRETVDRMLKAARTRSHDSDFSAFQQLVRDGANIVFCTTSNADLDKIATGQKTFDWSIIEEAGRVHGYDLALPMSVGHRWLLVGDQRQLEAYRFEAFAKALEVGEMEASTKLLRRLAERNSDVVDREWPQEWDEMKDTLDARWKQDVFLRRARRWLKTFENIYSSLKSVKNTEVVTQEHPVESAVGRLVNQYRMHPAIGTLVADAYYRESTSSSASLLVQNMTGTIESPDTDVVHTLTLPAAITGIPIVWLDVPWCKERGSPSNARERGDVSFTNLAEAELIVAFCRQLAFAPGCVPDPPYDIAVLSPYKGQKEILERRLRSAFPDGYNQGLAVKAGLYGRRRDPSRQPFTHTVDSFQGNEADAIIISLTRNNDRPPGGGIGFLKEAPRMNVLFSRAQRLLVLVGSWDFFQYQVRDVDPDGTHIHAHLKRVMLTLESFERAPVRSFARLRHLHGVFRQVP